VRSERGLIEERTLSFLNLVRARTASFAITALVLAIAPIASAQDHSAAQRAMTPRLYGFAQVGVLGDVTVRSGNDRGTLSLEPSGGAGVGFEVPLAHVFSIGAEADGWGWNSDRGSDWDVGPSAVFDLSVVPRLRLPWSTAGHAHGEVGLAFPVGPSVSFINGDSQFDLSRWGTHIDAGWGAHVGVMLNAQFFPIERFGFTFDLGYVHHFAWHDVHSTVLGVHQMQIDFGQLVARAGIIVLL
jgi:hypothetical protein